jgi:RNA polymerase sigma-70 factor (ECF subfamily)
VDPLDPEQITPGPAQFRTTHWSLVVRATGSEEASSRQALEQLCRTYWLAVYAFILRRGYATEDAKDLTQAFFARLLEKDWLRSADASKGRFRTFLLTAASRFLGHERERSEALKRGGGQHLFSLDAAKTEPGWVPEPMASGTPEDAFERRWAESLLNRVMGRLREEFESGGRVGRFEALKRYLTEDRGETSYAALADQLAMSEAAIKSSIYRLRARYGELVREEIANTVDDPAEVPTEIRHLISVLGS